MSETKIPRIDVRVIVEVQGAFGQDMERMRKAQLEKFVNFLSPQGYQLVKVDTDPDDMWVSASFRTTSVTQMTPDEIRGQLNFPLEQTTLSRRIISALEEWHRITTLADLILYVRKMESNNRRAIFRNIGEKSAQEINTLLIEYGINSRVHPS